MQDARSMQVIADGVVRQSQSVTTLDRRDGSAQSVSRRAYFTVHTILRGPLGK